MRHLTATLPLLSIVLLTGGCAGFFEQEIELEALPYERRLVLNVILSPQDSLIRADVFVTAPAVGDVPPDYPRNGVVEDARLHLKSPAGSFPFYFESRNGTYELPQATGQLETGRMYEVTAEWDGLTARGRTVIPELNIPTDSIVLEDVDNDEDWRIRVSWPNQSGEQDYYLLYADQAPRDYRGDLQRDIVDYIRGRAALGPEITGDDFYLLRGAKNTINVCQTTRATYDYLQTRETLTVNDENPFAEPTTVANDMQEGLGLVGAANCWQMEF